MAIRVAPSNALRQTHVGQRGSMIYNQETVLASSTALAVNSGRLFYAPVYLPGFQINRLMVEITVAGTAATKGLIGFYTNVDALPGAKIATSPEFALDATGQITITLPSTVTLPDTYCWVAYQGASQTTFTIGSAARSALLGATLFANTHRSIWVPRVYDATLPDPAPTAGYDTASMPLVGMFQV